MPLDIKRQFSLEVHVFPILEQHGFNPRWDDPKCPEYIYTLQGRIAICNTNHLFVEGTEELGKWLLEHIRPFGEELTIHLYPAAPSKPKKPPLIRIGEFLEKCDEIVGKFLGSIERYI